MFHERAEGCRRSATIRGLAVGLAAIVRDGREVADVIEVRVAHEARVQAELGPEIEPARERARVDGERSSRTKRWFDAEASPRRDSR
jgi:hypothetical protein